MWEHQLARSLMKMIWQSAPLRQLNNVQGEFLHLAQFHGVASHWQVCLTSRTFNLIFRARSCFHTFGSSSFQRNFSNYVSDCFHSLACCFNPCWESLRLDFTRNTQIYRKEFTDSKDPLVVAVGVRSDL